MREKIIKTITLSETNKIPHPILIPIHLISPIPFRHRFFSNLYGLKKLIKGSHKPSVYNFAKGLVNSCFIAAILSPKS